MTVLNRETAKLGEFSDESPEEPDDDQPDTEPVPVTPSPDPE
jgi:hypothetical protein